MFWLLMPLLSLITGVNATGWAELYDGNIITAAFVMYDTAFAGYTIVILFLVYQFLAYMKTRTLMTGWIMGILLVSLFGISTMLSATGVPFFKPLAMQIIFVILVMEFAGILYYWLWK
jgi:hypothetical protein